MPKLTLMFLACMVVLLWRWEHWKTSGLKKREISFGSSLELAWFGAFETLKGRCQVGNAGAPIKVQAWRQKSRKSLVYR